MFTMLRILLRLGLIHPQAPAEQPAVSPSPTVATATEDETRDGIRGSDPLTPTLRAIIEADPDAEQRVNILLDDDVDIAALKRKHSDGAALMRALRRIRLRQQAPLMKALEREGVPSSKRSQMVMVNAVSVTAKGSVILRIAARKDVRAIEQPTTYYPTKPKTPR